ncbi:MAG: hypothetical protein HRU09_15255 [Oligoflexales bacterium]|nr:hypothetical protein [Oligoflexales bacterium]
MEKKDRAIGIEEASEAREATPTRSAGQLDREARIRDALDQKIRRVEGLDPGAIRDAQLAELNNRKLVLLKNNELFDLDAQATKSLEEWTTTSPLIDGDNIENNTRTQRHWFDIWEESDAFFKEKGRTMSTEEVESRGFFKRNEDWLFEVEDGKHVRVGFTDLDWSKETTIARYKHWTQNRAVGEQYKAARADLKVQRDTWKSSATKPYRDTLQSLDSDNAFKTNMLVSRALLDNIDSDKPFALYDFKEDKVIPSTDVDAKGVTVPNKPELTSRAVAGVDPTAGVDATKVGTTPKIVRYGIIGGLAASLLGAVLLGFGLTDSGHDGGANLVATEGQFLYLLNSCKNKWVAGCEKVQAAAMK